MLILSIVALFAGPLLYQWLRAGGRFAHTVDRVLVIVLVVLVVFLLVPESIGEMGVVALAVIAAGYFTPWLLELAIRRAAHAFHMFSLAFALLGLGMHALLDGAGLAGNGAHGSHSLELAIVLHRFGVGLVLWMMVQPALGRAWAIGMLVMMSVATVMGYVASEALISIEGEGVVHVLHALITGVIIHSLVHRGHVHKPH
ncbi:hypothetical protein F3N42_07935 [Marinihelvus fidelis]|uniref:Uncharacterized protein n=1 Tax=Marinihelvus fidelis TaxID=2613842 RepID=A0A5N0TBN9_9GAMM|nr:hypothetical protein [Marinihelvus fidelis]KAA9132088.1 hypothetical protein F3N42_07935 [Marinihelvus fidelis]